jgi:NAD(P)H-hydrate epimerase
MEQAGTEAFFFILNKYPQMRHWAVFCGAGNNAGDGYVVARLAHEHGIIATVYQHKAPEALPEAARHAALAAVNSGVDFLAADEPIDPEADLIVDALLGIGLKGPVYGVIATAIEQINASSLPVISLDVPSGLNADTGQVEHIAVRASHTVTFIARKAGMYTLDGPDHCGVISCRQLQLDSVLDELKPFSLLLHQEEFSALLPKRKNNSHKGDYGHILVIGGGLGMPGAVGLAAKAALRTGAGAVTIATHPTHVGAVLSLAPEAMVWGVSTAKELEPLLHKASFCVLGPGLGETHWASTLFAAAISSQLPMLIDASALRLLAQQPQIDDNWVLTPHPGEAASLLSCASHEIQADRFVAAAAIQQRYGGVVVLKGAGSIIHTAEGDQFICSKGNPGMASAGMGDVLSGIIAGLAAQGLTLVEAAKLGVWVHALAADKKVGVQGERGLLASDLLDLLPNILNGL